MKITMQKTSSELAQEVALLRSSVIGLIGKDSEGEYHPTFVAQTLASINDAAFDFSGPGDFLSRIQKPKTKHS